MLKKVPPTHLSLRGPFMAGSRLNTELGREELIWGYLLSCDFT